MAVARDADELARLKKQLVRMGLDAAYPVNIVFGRIPEPVRQLTASIMFDPALFEKTDAEILADVKAAILDPTIGMGWISKAEFSASGYNKDVAKRNSAIAKRKASNEKRKTKR